MAIPTDLNTVRFARLHHQEAAHRAIIEFAQRWRDCPYGVYMGLRSRPLPEQNRHERTGGSDHFVCPRTAFSAVMA